MERAGRKGSSSVTRSPPSRRQVCNQELFSVLPAELKSTMMGCRWYGSESDPLSVPPRLLFGILILHIPLWSSVAAPAYLQGFVCCAKWRYHLFRFLWHAFERNTFGGEVSPRHSRRIVYITPARSLEGHAPKHIWLPNATGGNRTPPDWFFFPSNGS